ncbi:MULTISPECIES: UDP-N-acetylmuramoyl-L-alanine--D-glutamate ligase [Aliivibrio]|uniref:UDP-N-acetylmuramoylalanine--D-glutamate ligase n=1 Tax=Aliivibrio finisterrensis TaxID=511998 RepID=A0A4Q5KVQ3_9GAMM|nr:MULTISPECIES: UDP-N-acetylmuramoyl-L-alanine--D-glutamate ligase [Aliivibrio]MDD9178203.1 UDP-N-acetylmuramoyl-L-alanine--D-glutamate ligase [Aliivibrio sp. A6]RYU52682.1 UDP-N-acetylmuramoyl-L-alanine--D-glutamate ligase [Aliivibrio finisterrensis]RYU55789.1 UDP-N-acetylmuramoyl-L-alanine--D-glutamate ligase [Aliivibrio finisterrensis]RYU60629.1 UDP-N-acetylmuramoyl-L-alanine--D-glutamate ligase [Aliivibrio finisterrensis]RYU66276.1 UDP-N-acetylmuramoyl-L-alanine--D-glutamate ligase [Aliiv
MSGFGGVKNVVVVGLGMTGLSVVKHLLRQPEALTIKVIDTRDTPPGHDQLPKNVELHSGGWQQDWLINADLIVTNPGIALASPQLIPAIDKGIQIVGDIELFAWAVNAPVIAITGSNGKSTVTDLTGEMAKAAGVKTAVGGNIGFAALDLLEQDAELYVLELSSFQLETTSTLKLKAAAFLNLSEDHMDRYQGMADYRQAKLRIFDHAEVGIVNRDDKQTYPDVEKTVKSFGFDQGDYGCIEKDGIEYLAKDSAPIIAASELGLVGKHNIANALVAIALLDAVGIDIKSTLDTLRTYNGLTHRCQVVADNGGIRWVNDSKATNVASTLAALSGLNIDGKLHLLVGGVGKGADFSELSPALKALDLMMYCFGEDGPQFIPLDPRSGLFQTMDEALASLFPTLNAGDMVMLSPACASFDQYANFMARGDAFTQLAKQYSAES